MSEGKLKRTAKTPHLVPLHGYYPVSTSLTLEQQIPLAVHGLDSVGGMVTTFGSTPAWTADPAAGVLTPSADGLSCVFAPSLVGDATVTVTALAKAGDVDPLTTSIVLTVTEPVVAPVAVSLSIVPGEPEPKPAAV